MKANNESKQKMIKKLYSEGETVYSFSRLNVDCDYEYHNTYNLRERGTGGIYGLLGGFFHDTIEQIINGELERSQMKPLFFEKLAELEMLGVNFPNEKIKNSWIADMTHAVDHLQLIDGKLLTESLALFQVEGSWIQGYVDVIQPTDTKPYVNIVDWKTSSRFVGKKLENAGRQLLMYKLALESTTNFKVDKLMWNMLKYTEITWNNVLKSGKLSPKSTISNRGKWVDKLKTNLKNDLLMGGMDDLEVDIYLTEAIKNNNVDNFPPEIKAAVEAKYTFNDYILEYEVTDERMDELKQFVKNRVEVVEAKDKTDESQWKPIELVSDHDTFYCANLCNHRKTCKFLKEFQSGFKDREKEVPELDKEIYDLFN